MRKYLVNGATRFFLFVSGSVVWAGILLTGIHNVHWLLFVPAGFFIFAAITGICPGMIVSNLLFGRKCEPADSKTCCQ